ncbi:unnamed protein product [Lasius platythorax]|uniref:Transmembrane protein n=1 Tax=Lasius platythorax TaxID=488582 RepID=A0AAV2N2M3_9HYME
MSCERQSRTLGRMVDPIRSEARPRKANGEEAMKRDKETPKNRAVVAVVVVVVVVVHLTALKGSTSLFVISSHSCLWE